VPTTDDAALRAETSRRRQRQWVALVVALAGSLAVIPGVLAFAAHRGGAVVASAMVGLIMPLWIGLFWYSRRNWRCAACDAPLPGSTGSGYMFDVPACPGCGRALR
jgi:hypothetical protein